MKEAHGDQDSEDDEDDEIIKPASELPECWQPMNVASTDGPFRLWESMKDEVRSAAASAGCTRLSLFVALSTLAAFALVIGNAPHEPPRSRFRQLVAAKSAAALKSGALVPLPTTGSAAVRDHELGVTFLVSFASEQQQTTAPAISAAAVPPSSALSKSHDPFSIENREPDLEVLRGATVVDGVDGLSHDRPPLPSSPPSSSDSSWFNGFFSSVFSGSTSTSSRGVGGDSSERYPSHSPQAVSTAAAAAVFGSSMLGQLFNGFSVVLNKFPTLPDHLLVVTDSFEEQGSTPLKATHLNALFVVIHQLPGVGFFNSGSEAGASQPHRHLQVLPVDVLQSFGAQCLVSVGSDPASVPVPPIDELLNKYVDKTTAAAAGATVGSAAALPVDTATTLPAATTEEEEEEFKVISVPEFPFVHAFVALPPHLDAPSPTSGKVLERAYRSLLDHCEAQLQLPTVGVGGGVGDVGGDRSVGGSSSSSSSDSGGGGGGGSTSSSSWEDRPPLQGTPYNLVVTHKWMLLVPRVHSLASLSKPPQSAAAVQSSVSIDVNGMGFLGLLLVRHAPGYSSTDQQLPESPTRILRSVAVPC